MNPVLYRRAMFLCRLPFEKVRLTGTTADGYLRALLEQDGVDWIVNIDEDAFVCDIPALERLIAYCQDEGYDNCGMPDGGVVSIRSGNPLVTNPFFNILHVGCLREAYGNGVQYGSVDENSFPQEARQRLKGCFDFHNDSEEPFYPLFLWMSQRRRTLYLHAYDHPDGVSTVLCNHLGEPFLIHTWYSRFYNHDFRHTRRINRAFREACDKQGLRYRTPVGDVAACVKEQSCHFLLAKAVAAKHALLGKKK